MTPDLSAIYRAGRVRRWHTHADVSATADFLDGHQGRVARLMLALHPRASRDLLAAALTHDDDEAAVGDIPGPVKARLRREQPEFMAAVDRLGQAHRAALWTGRDIGTASAEDLAWLTLCDRLDAFMWVRAHAGHLLVRDDWLDEASAIIALAHRVGASERAVIGAMTE